MAAHDNLVLVNSSGGAVTITLPAPTNGRILIVKDSTGNASTHNITIDPHASETIDGASSIIINTNWGEVQLQSDGTNWFTNIQSGVLLANGTIPLTANWNAGAFDISASAFIPTGSAVPVNGMYLGATNTVDFSTNTTYAGKIDASQNWNFPNQIVIGSGAIDGSVVVAINGNVSLTGASQEGFRSEFTLSSAATTTGVGMVASVKTAATSYTVGSVYNFQSRNVTVGAGSSITTFAAFQDTAAANHPGTNNATLADNYQPSGNWFLAQGGTDPSTLGGQLSIGTSVH